MSFVQLRQLGEARACSRPKGMSHSNDNYMDKTYAKLHHAEQFRPPGLHDQLFV